MCVFGSVCRGKWTANTWHGNFNYAARLCVRLNRLDRQIFFHPNYAHTKSNNFSIWHWNYAIKCGIFFLSLSAEKYSDQIAPQHTSPTGWRGHKALNHSIWIRLCVHNYITRSPTLARPTHTHTHIPQSKIENNFTFFSGNSRTNFVWKLLYEIHIHRTSLRWFFY